jgi:hypothetical protein
MTHERALLALLSGWCCMMAGCGSGDEGSAGRARIVRPAEAAVLVVDFSTGQRPVLLDVRGATPAQLEAVSLRCPNGQLMRLDRWLEARSAEVGRDLVADAARLGYLALSAPAEPMPRGPMEPAPPGSAGSSPQEPPAGSCDADVCGEACDGCEQRCVVCSDGLSVCYTSCAAGGPPADACVVL